MKYKYTDSKKALTTSYKKYCFADVESLMQEINKK